MSAIDTVYHEVIGQIKGIPLYRLLENAPSDAKENMGFDGKKGDILLGGGSGEVAAMRISMPETLQWLTDDKMDMILKYNFHELVQTHWTNNDAYEFISRYIKMGYNPKEVNIENWLTSHILSYMLQTFPEDYLLHVGSLLDEDGEKKLEYQGEICSAPDPTWVEHNKNWFKHRGDGK